MKKIAMYFEFDAVVSTDFGIIKYIQKNIHNEDFFKPDILNTKDGIYLRYILKKRRHPNPLSIILRDEYMNSMDSLYFEIMNENKKAILDLSLPNDICNYAIIVGSSAANAVCKIGCKDDLEKDYINKLNGKNVFPIDIITDDLNPYDAVCLMNYPNLADLKVMLRGTRIYVPDYQYNLEDRKDINGNKLPLLSTSILFEDTCPIFLINPDKRIADELKG